MSDHRPHPVVLLLWKAAVVVCAAAVGCTVLAIWTHSEEWAQTAALCYCVGPALGFAAIFAALGTD